MSVYTLDDTKFTTEPLTQYVPQGEQTIDRSILEEEFKKNRELANELKKEYELRTGKSLV